MDGKQAFSKPGTADLPPAYGEVAFDERGARQFLQNNGFPLGFVNAVIRSRQTFAQRYWIVDNSGSMASADGQRLASGAGSAGKLVRCTRWEEAVDMLNFHAALAAALAAPTTFTLLNPPANGAPQTVVVADAQSASTLHTSLAGGPGGGTPLCQAVRNVVTAVLADEHAIRAAGRRVTVVILSDGLPSDGDLALALAPLARLPVWLVVRLCCDEQPVLDFWSKVDSSLEIEMDVLDDLRGEAAECAKMNGWLAYGPPLHRLREWGIQDKVRARPCARRGRSRAARARAPGARARTRDARSLHPSLPAHAAAARFPR
jgi:Mg-chelatase subunit ChlD